MSSRKSSDKKRAQQEAMDQPQREDETPKHLATVTRLGKARPKNK